MKPFGKTILFKPFPSKEMTEGGILVPESARKTSNRGTITAVGERVTKVMEGNTGYRVKELGTELVVDGEKYFLMDESAIIALD